MRSINYKKMNYFFGLSMLCFTLLITSGCQEDSSNAAAYQDQSNNNNDNGSNNGSNPLTVSLSWDPPLYRTDESLLTDLSGYRLYYGTSSGNYTEVVNIDNAGITDYILENMPSNTYFFVITAIDSQGIESKFSNEVKKTPG